MGRLAPFLLAALLAGCSAGGSLLRSEYKVLRDDAIWQVQVGQTQAQVREMFGPPYDTMAFPRTGTTAWDYRYVDTWGYQAILSVTFGPDGRVVSRISQRIERDRLGL